MYDQSFNRVSLLRTLTKDDFFRYPSLFNDEYKKNIISDALNFVDYSLLHEDTILSKPIKSKEVYEFDGITKKLVYRKVNNNIKAIYSVKQSNRDRIVKQLIAALEEGIRYKVIKLDIKRFYESFDIDTVEDVINYNSKLSSKTKKLIVTLLKAYRSKGNQSGLPRGMAISATISEIMMSSFDSLVQSTSGVYFYFRYVDDIIIITDFKFNEDEIETLEGYLPKGLFFNRKKTNISKVTDIGFDKNNKLLASLSYLGYNFDIKQPNKTDGCNQKNFAPRKVEVDISSSKVKKLKTRIIRSILDYNRSGDFNLFRNRIKVITSNYSLLDKKKKIRVSSGVYFNYKRVNIENPPSIIELDLFLKAAITGRIGKVKIVHKISRSKRNELFKYTFRNGFENKAFVHFSFANQEKIHKVWAYV